MVTMDEAVPCFVAKRPEPTSVHQGTTDDGIRLNLFFRPGYRPEFLATDPEARVRFPALQHFLGSSGSATEPTQPREYN
jgi:hypothetical protein